MIAKTKLTLKPIHNLLGEDFFIPAYQRGYRWTKRQVQELLDDIWEFRVINDGGSSDAFYCLQPVVVVNNSNNYWEVVDGQQRLTTIYIILSFLEKEHLRRPLKEAYDKSLFSIIYKTRTDSEKFLSNIDLNQKEDNVDYYHICTAYETIKTWFENKNYNECNDFLHTLLAKEDKKPVAVIWYDLSDECNNVDNSDYAIDVFTRINIGKIPLTNAELIKALFLGKIKLKDTEHITLKRLQIAAEWDIIENTLQQDDFWHFIHKGIGNYDTRIEYIFDLMKDKKISHEQYYTFHKFNDDFNEGKPIDDIWLDIKKYFQYFQDWFNNRTVYHYVGYLIETGENIVSLVAEAKKKTKQEFKDYLLCKIKNKIDLSRNEVDELEYGNNKVKDILLLFNIQTLVANSRSLDRFPFYFFYTDGGWDIEHIRSQQLSEPTSKKEQEKWLRVILEYFIGEEVQEQDKPDALENINNESEKAIAHLIDRQLGKEDISDNFSICYKEVLDFFKENDDPENVDSIANLTLLNNKINRAYKNAPFRVKRKTILEEVKHGIFIPLCTQNVFLKAYNSRFDNLQCWGLEQNDNNGDGNQYVEAIKSTLKNFLIAKEDGGTNDE